VTVKGRQQRHVKGRRRSLWIQLRASPQLKLSLMNMAALKRMTVSRYVEEALWKILSRDAARKGAKFHARLRHANCLIEQVIAEAFVTQVAGNLDVANVHRVDTRQQRRNRISEKCEAAFDEVYDLAQSEKLAKENRTRAVFYAVLAQLAQVNETILQGASDEEVLAQIQQLREEQRRFETTTREMEDEARESSAKK